MVVEGLALGGVWCSAEWYSGLSAFGPARCVLHRCYRLCFDEVRHGDDAFMVVSFMKSMKIDRVAARGCCLKKW